MQLRPLRLLRLLAVCGLIGFSLTQLSACGLVPGLDLPSGQEGDNGPPSTGDQDGNGGMSPPGGTPNGGGTSTGGAQGYPEQHQQEPEPVGGAAGQLGDDPPAEEAPSDEMEEGENDWAEFF